MMIRRAFLALMISPAALIAGLDNKKIAYVGGTVSTLKEGEEGSIDVSSESAVSFQFKSGGLRILYSGIDSIEYGQKAGRRVGVAVAISPLALFSKKRKHYLTLGYLDAEGKRQGVVFELGKDLVRTVLVNLEAKTGKRVEYESEEARKHTGN